MEWVWIGIYLFGVVVVISLWDWLVIYPDRRIYSERIQIRMWFDLQDRKRLYYRLKKEKKLWKQYIKRSG